MLHTLITASWDPDQQEWWVLVVHLLEDGSVKPVESGYTPSLHASLVSLIQEHGFESPGTMLTLSSRSPV